MTGNLPAPGMVPVLAGVQESIEVRYPWLANEGEDKTPSGAFGKWVAWADSAAGVFLVPRHVLALAAPFRNPMSLV